MHTHIFRFRQAVVQVTSCISAMMHFAFSIYTMLLNKQFVIYTVVVGVVKLHGKLRRLPPTVKLVLCVSCLCEFMSHTILPQAIFSCQTGILSDLHKSWDFFPKNGLQHIEPVDQHSFAKDFPILLCQIS